MANWGDERLPPRFWNRTIPDPNSGCWLWTGALSNGFGVYWENGRQRPAHRAAWCALVGPAPEFTLHACNESSCANPAHLRPSGASRAGDLTGVRRHRLVAVARIPDDGKHHPRWLCECDCGGQRIVIGSHFRRGVYKHCGCDRAPKTKGLYTRPVYSTWLSMVQRCSNPRASGFETYGGRGISVCDRWRGARGFLSFVDDMGEPPPGMSLDRIDCNGNYEPGNCRWADQSTQQFNRRSSVGRTRQLFAGAIADVQSSLKNDYSKADVVSLLRDLSNDICGRSS